MAATYEPIATTTLGSAASSITFSSIASTWTDLRVVLTCTGSGTIYPNAILNNDTSSLYSMTFLYGDGSSAGSYRGTNNTSIAMVQNGTSTIPAFYTLDIFSYAGSTYKTILGTASEDQNGSGAVSRIVNLYRSTSAITRLDLRGGGNNFATGTTATIWGIKAA
jgi:hypothetical protein